LNTHPEKSDEIELKLEDLSKDESDSEEIDEKVSLLLFVRHIFKMKLKLK